jgi:hypothetical protein
MCLIKDIEINSNKPLLEYQSTYDIFQDFDFFPIMLCYDIVINFYLHTYKMSRLAVYPRVDTSRKFRTSSFSMFIRRPKKRFLKNY